ncbi:exopolysaccharide biosynthesis polyprenyl glycosylphosphotransferase [Dietzia maris]|uniref:exopolysaccharide biosynthesis polyprenyl glycosylphosphotransferase n=1 Tax=Dietzia maris TaxID=37915 RepID=UPI0021B06310|nr:exopolysaccharide biosynthesis polyprenyl glycosylphosphotransferase [Dietzia maris]
MRALGSGSARLRNLVGGLLRIAELLTLIGLALLLLAMSSLWPESQAASKPDYSLAIAYAVLWAVCLSALDAYSPYYWVSGLELYALPIRSVIPFAGCAALLLVIFDLRVDRWYSLLFLLFCLVALLAVRVIFRSVLRLIVKKELLQESTVILLETAEDWPAIKRMLDGAGGLFRVDSVVGTSREFADQAGLAYRGSPAVLADWEEGIAPAVLIANAGSLSREDLDRLAWLVSDTGTHLTIIVDPLLVSSPRLKLRSVFGVVVGEATLPGLNRIQAGVKRSFDLAVSSLALIVLSPLFALIAAAVYFEDRGSVFFKQDRVGASLSTFTIYKFRTMFVGADRMEKALRVLHHRPGEMWKVDDDPRITRVGGFLRKSSLDELPQLINVFKGDMSLVGPRPKQAWELESYDDRQLRRFTLVPGVTGLSQVSGRSDLSLDEAVELDLEYGRNWSLGRDIVICLRTAVQLATARGAY